MTDDTHHLSRRTVLRTTAALAGAAALPASARASTNTNAEAAGTVGWTRPATTLASAPAYADGAVYVVDGGGTLLCCDAATGEDRWAAGAGGTVRRGGLDAAAGAVVTGTEGGVVAAFDAADGAKRWERSVAGEVTSLELVGDTLLYGLDGAVGALDPSSGGVRWPATAACDTYAPLRAGVTDGVAVFASDIVSVRGVSLADGTTAWEHEVPDWDNEASTAAVDAADGAAYLGGEYGRLMRVEAADGSVTWRTELDDDSFVSVLVSGDAVVAVGDAVHVRSASTGRARYSVGVEAYGRPAVRDGELVVAGTDRSGDRVVLGVELATGVTDWRYPLDDEDWASLSGTAAGPAHAFFVDEYDETLTAVRRTAAATPTPTRTPTDTPEPTPPPTRTAESTPEATRSPAPSATTPGGAATANADGTTTPPPRPDVASGEARGFFAPGDDVLGDVLTPWGLTVLGFGVSIGGVVYQSYRDR